MAAFPTKVSSLPRPLSLPPSVGRPSFLRGKRSLSLSLSLSLSVSLSVSLSLSLPLSLSIYLLSLLLSLLKYPIRLSNQPEPGFNNPTGPQQTNAGSSFPSDPNAIGNDGLTLYQRLCKQVFDAKECTDSDAGFTVSDVSHFAPPKFNPPLCQVLPTEAPPSAMSPSSSLLRLSAASTAR